jgi:hypothetical protein
MNIWLEWEDTVRSVVLVYLVTMNVLGPVGELWRRVPPHDGVQLCMSATLDVGVQEHHDKHIVQRYASDLRPGDEEVHTDHDQLIHCNKQSSSHQITWNIPAKTLHMLFFNSKIYNKIRSQNTATSDGIILEARAEGNRLDEIGSKRH